MRMCKVIPITVGILLLAGLLCAFLLSAIARAIRMGKYTSCLNNLALLDKTMREYEVRFGSPPSDRGGEFWTRLGETRPPLASSELGYRCILRETPSPGATDYRGPSGDIGKYGPDDPIAADRIDNHGRGEGGNVLLKCGEVCSVPEGDVLWALATTLTAP